jgi:hypothetical protein
MQGRRGILLWGGDQPGAKPFCPGKKFALTWFLGLRALSPSPVVLKEVLPAIKGKEPTTKVGSCSVSTISVLVIPQVILPSMPEDKQGVQSTVAGALPSAQVCSSSVGSDVTAYSH